VAVAPASTAAAQSEVEAEVSTVVAAVVTGKSL